MKATAAVRKAEQEQNPSPQIRQRIRYFLTYTAFPIPLIFFLIWGAVVIASGLFTIGVILGVLVGESPIKAELQTLGISGGKVPVTVEISRRSLNGKWTCNGVKGDDSLRFFPEGSNTHWSFECDSYDALPDRITLYHGESSTSLISVSGKISVPGGQTPGIVSGTLSGYIVAPVSSGDFKHFGVEKVRIKSSLTITVLDQEEFARLLREEERRQRTQRTLINISIPVIFVLFGAFGLWLGSPQRW